MAYLCDFTRKAMGLSVKVLRYSTELAIATPAFIYGFSKDVLEIPPGAKRIEPIFEQGYKIINRLENLERKLLKLKRFVLNIN